MNSIITRQNGIIGFHKWRAMLILALLMCFGAGEAWATAHGYIYSDNVGTASVSIGGDGLVNHITYEINGNGSTSVSYWFTTRTRTITITASVNTNQQSEWEFMHWVDEDNNNNVVSTNPTYSYSQAWNGDDRHFRAKYKRKKFNINVSTSPTAGGSAWIDDDTSLTSALVECSFSHKVTASEATGYRFVNWTGTYNTSDNPFTFTMPTNNVNLTANFEKISYTLTVNASPSAGGTVSGGGSYLWGTSRTVTATANADYNFSCWTDNNGIVVSRNASYTFTMPQYDYTLTAHFVGDTWNEDLIADKVYTVTTENDRFRVSCPNSNSINHDQTFLYLGNLVASSGTVTINFNNTSPILMNHRIKVQNGSTLNLTNANNDIVTLKRNTRSDYLFKIEAGGTLNIQGNANGAKFKVDGGTAFSTEFDARTEMTTEGNSGDMFKAIGNLTIANAVLQNGRGCCILGDNTTSTLYNLTLTDVTIQGFYAAEGAGLYPYNVDYHNAVLTGVTISGCYSYGGLGGTIRTNGGVRTRLTLDNCTIQNSYSCGHGGGIYWNACGEPGFTEIIITGNTKILDNETALKGGGIFVESKMDLQSATISGNKALYGGGIYLSPYQGGAREFSGDGYNLSITNAVHIIGNKAKKVGGGVYMDIRPTNDVGFDPNGVAISPEFKLEMLGGEISGNYAPKGAGLGVEDFGPYKHLNGRPSETAYQQWSEEYRRTIDINGGEIKNNFCNDTCDYVMGAGIYIRKFDSLEYYQSTSDIIYIMSEIGAGTFNVDARGGYIYGNSARNNNKNGVGGGLYIDNEIPGEPYNGICNVAVSGAVEFYDNKCDGNGAGLHLANGSITIDGGIIGKEGHPNISYQGNGAGVFVANGNVTIDNGSIDYNQAKCSNDSGGYGGAFYLTGGVATINGGSVSHNSADKDGGGFYVDTEDANALTTIKGGATVAYNSAINGGGAFVNKGNFIIQDSGTNLSGNIASVDGGGVYVVNGVVNVNTGAIVQDNRAYDQGGGIYMANGTFNLNGGAIGANEHPNTSDKTGGGVYLGGAGKFNMSGGSIGYNVGTTGGGGAYVNGNDPDPSLKAELNITGGSVNNNSAPNNGANGGGIYVNKGDVLIQNATVSNNTSKGGGAGVYVTKGNVTIDASTVSGNETATGNGGGLFVNNTDNSNSIIIRNGAKINGTNKGKNGGGLYVAKGQVFIEGSTTQISGNQATANGGGIYADGGEITIQGNPTINGNQASVNGGGIYANSDINFNGGTISNNIANSGGGLYIPASSAILNFTNGTFDSNQATANGGGIYISNGATLNLFGNATISGNHVPEGKKGGGVYLRGDLFVGGTDGVQSMQCRTNYAGTSGKAATPNNVFLATNDNYVTLKSDIANSGTNIGISVDDDSSNEKRRVVHVEDASDEKMLWLDNLLEGTTLTGALSDDSQSHIAIHTDNSVGEYNNQFIYFTGCWTTMVQSDPGEQHIQKIGGVYHIKTSQGLSWFSSLVNGVNNQTADRTLNAVLDNDIDMSANIWVPLGSLTYDPDHSSFSESSDSYYTGNFDGQGHVIKGISNGYLSGISKYGLFGAIGSSAKVENTLLDEYSYLAVNAGEYYMGGITGVSTGNATISNCEAKGTMSVAVCNGNSCAGGLVGSMEGTSKAHSSMAMPEFANGAAAIPMGGIAGQTASGTNILNSFANVKVGTSNGNVGGLVGVNNGTVENCYVRLQSGSANPAGWFTADGDGTVSYCYAPSIATGVQTGTNGNYGDTQRVNGKYGFGQQDQLVEATNDYVEDEGDLLASLNNWVGDSETYSKWTRTMASPINDDYPILEFNDFVCAASNDGVFIAYEDDLNDMIANANDNTNGGSIYLYKTNPVEVNTNTNNNVRVYIGENIGLLQATGNRLNARVGVTLDNSSGMSDDPFMAYDWHMFSTPLAAAPMGITYNNATAHGAGQDIAASDITLTGQGYLPSNTGFGNFDFYCYSEPDYHWINFKRNSNDHWHQDANDNGGFDPIDYANESTMTPGKGYMMAVNQPTMVMADGQLNNAAEVGVTLTATEKDGEPVAHKGTNLVGNPYQSYLNFDTFAGSTGISTYYVLDADKKGYIAYTQDAEDNENNAPKLIHPHQGFFVKVDNGTPIKFTAEMREASGNAYSTFRGETHYPLVNLVCSDEAGRNDYATVELNRPEQGGGEKAKGLHAGNASIWTRLGETDYHIAFAPEGTTTVPVRFKAYKDGVFTLSWGTANGDFSYLHLIDNKTGMDIDCLTTDSYAFEGSTENYLSRFKLVFDYTGIEEDEDGTSTGSASFAFQMGDELVVNGEGMLQVFDVNGRCLVTRELHGTQSAISLPTAAAGVYVLRLTSGESVKVQKMVVR